MIFMKFPGGDLFRASVDLVKDRVKLLLTRSQPSRSTFDLWPVQTGLCMYDIVCTGHDPCTSVKVLRKFQVDLKLFRIYTKGQDYEL